MAVRRSDVQSSDGIQVDKERGPTVLVISCDVV